MKLKVLISLILSFCLTLASVALAADKVVSDDAIHDNVMRKLASDQIVKGGGLKIDVKNGVVTLAGVVEQEKQKDRATRLTKKVSGVKSVDNQLQVARKGPGK